MTKTALKSREQTLKTRFFYWNLCVGVFILLLFNIFYFHLSSWKNIQLNNFFIYLLV